MDNEVGVYLATKHPSRHDIFGAEIVANFRYPPLEESIRPSLGERTIMAIREVQVNQIKVSVASNHIQSIHSGC